MADPDPIIGSGSNIDVSSSSTPYNAQIKGDQATLKTGIGNDKVTITGNSDTLNLGDGDNTATVTGNGSTITSGTGNDTIKIDGFGNKIDAGAGNNDITVSSGNQVTTGSGDDVFNLTGANIIKAGDGTNTAKQTGDGLHYTGGSGSDNVTASGSHGTINLKDGNDNFVSLTGGSDHIIIGAGNHGTSNYTLSGGNNFVSINSSPDSLGTSNIYAFNPSNGDKIYLNGKSIDVLTKTQSDGNPSDATHPPMLMEVPNSHGGNDVIYNDGKQTIVIHDTTIAQLQSSNSISTTDMAQDPLFTPDSQAASTSVFDTAVITGAAVLSAGLTSFALGTLRYMSLRSKFKANMESKVQGIYEGQLQDLTRKHKLANIKELKAKNLARVSEKGVNRVISRSPERKQFIDNAKETWALSGFLAGAAIAVAAISFGLATAGIGPAVLFAVAAVVGVASGLATGYISLKVGEKFAEKQADKMIGNIVRNPKNKGGIEQAAIDKQVEAERKVEEKLNRQLKAKTVKKSTAVAPRPNAILASQQMQKQADTNSFTDRNPSRKNEEQNFKSIVETQNRTGKAEEQDYRSMIETQSSNRAAGVTTAG